MKNVRKQVPSILIIIALVGFPQISESIFTPVLPALSYSFAVSAQAGQLTVGSYFIGFAVGVLFCGALSDRIGRRPAMLLGVAAYLLGNVWLVLAGNFTGLLCARLLQAFGAAAGSVITQTIMREAFSGVAGERVFAKVSAAMALAPALGPLLGGWLLSASGDYRGVFGGLIAMALALLASVWWCLPETRVVLAQPSAWPQVAVRLLKSPRVWRYGLLISGINGILFGYYAEAPFVFEHHFGLTPMQYGWLGLIIALASIVGAMIVNALAGRVAPTVLINGGLVLAVIGAVWMRLAATSLPWSLVAVFVLFLGIDGALPLVLNRALLGFEDVIGTASGLLSFAYYLAISGLITLMSAMHDGTVFALPRYALVLTVVMAVVSLGAILMRRRG